jgi:ribokinase
MAVLTATVAIHLCIAGRSEADEDADRRIVVVGSTNVDITTRVARLPHKHETLVASSPITQVAVGGKGANQAVAAARLGRAGSVRTHFVTQFGNDAYASWLESTLAAEALDLSGCRHSTTHPSGQGLVLLEDDGSVSSVVVGGANAAWGESLTAESCRGLVAGGPAAVVMLQREIPESVNMAVATAAVTAGMPVILDLGGEDRPLPPEMLRYDW